MRRKIHLGPFQPALESALAAEISEFKKKNGPLAALTIIVPTRLLGLHLQRMLAHTLPDGHANLRFCTLTDLLPSGRLAPRLGLELLCDRIAKEKIPADGHFAAVRETRGFRSALLETFKDLEQAGLTPDALRKAAGRSKKLLELAAAYAAYCRWLADNGFIVEADLYVSTRDLPQPPFFVYGFYDLTAVQKQFMTKLAPAVVFFPEAQHNTYAEPLLDWFKSLGYKTETPRSAPDAPCSTLLSCPGETSEVHEALREALAFVDANGHMFNDVAILCRSRGQYDAVLRDTLVSLGIKAYFRGGRPLAEQKDAHLLSLLLETIRSDFNRATVMELACHLGPCSHWDALSVQLGIVGGQQQWRARLEAVTGAATKERTDQDDGRQRIAREMLGFVNKLFSLLGALPAEAKWSEYRAVLLGTFHALNGQNEAVIACVTSLDELEAFQNRVSFDAFSEYCQKSIEASVNQSERFQDGGIFVGDVMSARGLSWPLVVLLGLVEKSFPRVVSEDPLLLDDERVRISTALPRKLDGYDEEQLLFSLVAASARKKLVLSYPRLDPATSRPRVPSFLLLEHVGATSFKRLEEKIRAGHGWVPLSVIRDGENSLSERELDLAALDLLPDKSRYLQHVSPLLAGGVANTSTRWHEDSLTSYDGLLSAADALKLLCERFGLETTAISATSLEDFFGCPFYYFQKHILGIEPWDEPEAAVSINALDLGSLYHAILEEHYRLRAQDIVAVAERHFREFEHRGVTGYPTVWDIKKQIVLEELVAFVERDRGSSAGWQPAKFEQEFSGIVVAPPVRLRGKIDRLDLSDDKTRARVLDYKTGKQPRGVRDDSLVGGEALQLPLYILAAQQMLPKITVESASYLYFTLRGDYRTVTFTRGALEQRRAELTGLLETASKMIRQGIFAQYATPEGCRNCDFRPICGNGILKLYELKQGAAQMEGFRGIKEEVK